jgi:glutathione synthase/RimK-type ligase-like ATP-grasp enzyme
MIDRLNHDCFCISLDRKLLAHALESELGQPGLYQLVQLRNPHLFSAQPVFVTHRHAQHMRAVVQAVEAVAALPGYQRAVLATAPAAAQHDPGNPGVFLGFDFHLEADTLHLIEINTNPGGALLSAALARAQCACCAEMQDMVPSRAAVDAFEDEIIAMFLREWTQAGRAGKPRHVAIVDTAPADQYLYAEFLLFARLFERAGIAAVIADPLQLRLEQGRLWHGDQPVDLVYNRLTDFALDEAAHAALRQSWECDAAVITPHPRAHALFADKRNLVLLSDALALQRLGASADTAALLARHVPRTQIVTPSNAEQLWAERRSLFFKPWAGFGSRAAYRGAKLTKSVWANIVQGDYVAQALSPPGERRIGEAKAPQPLKFDLRAYADLGHVQWFSARLYQGQTTNFRTPGGGFAPVYTEPPATIAAPVQPRPMP